MTCGLTSHTLTPTLRLIPTVVADQSQATRHFACATRVRRVCHTRPVAAAALTHEQTHSDKHNRSMSSQRDDDPLSPSSPQGSTLSSSQSQIAQLRQFGSSSDNGTQHGSSSSNGGGAIYLSSSSDDDPDGGDESHGSDDDDSHSAAADGSSKLISGLNPFVALHSKFPEETSRILFLLALFSTLVGFGFFLAYIIQSHWIRTDDHPQTLVTFASQDTLPPIDAVLIGFDPVFFGPSLLAPELGPGSGGGGGAHSSSNQSAATLFRSVVPRFRSWSAAAQEPQTVTYNSCHSLLFFHDQSLCGRHNRSSFVDSSGESERVEIPPFRSPRDALEIEIFTFVNVSALGRASTSGGGQGRAFTPFPTPAVSLSILEPGMGRALFAVSPVSYAASAAGLVSAAESVEKSMPAPVLLELNSFYSAAVEMSLLTTLSDKRVWNQALERSPSRVELSAAQVEAAFARLLESYAGDPGTQSRLAAWKADPSLSFSTLSLHLRPASFRISLWLEVHSYSMFDFLADVGGMVALVLAGFALVFPFASPKPPSKEDSRSSKRRQMQQAAAAAAAHPLSSPTAVSAAGALSSSPSAASLSSNSQLLLQSKAELQRMLRAPRPRRFFALELWLRYQNSKQAQADATAAKLGSSSSFDPKSSPRIRRRPGGGPASARGVGGGGSRKYSASSSAYEYDRDHGDDEADDGGGAGSEERGQLRARSNSGPGRASEDSPQRTPPLRSSGAQRIPTSTPLRNALVDKEVMSPSSPLGSRSTDQELHSLKQPMLMATPL